MVIGYKNDSKSTDYFSNCNEKTGKTAKRPGFPEYTYCEVYEEPKKWYVAVHDGRTQILDNQEDK